MHLLDIFLTGDIGKPENQFFLQGVKLIRLTGKGAVIDVLLKPQPLPET